MGKAKFTAVAGERVCRIDLDSGEIEAEGIEMNKCRSLLKTLLDDNK